MPYSPPAGNSVNLVFSEPQTPPLQNGGSVVLVFSLDAGVQTNYVSPNAGNLIINLGAGAYSPPLGSNVIIDLGDTISDVAAYTKFLMFLNDTFNV